MVRELQRKFIKTTMLVVTVLMVIFLLAINAVNYYVSRSDTTQSLDRIAQWATIEASQNGFGDFAAGGPRDENKNGPGSDKNENPDEENENAGRFFSVGIRSDGLIGFYDFEHADGLEWDEMVELVNQVDVDFLGDITGETESETDSSAAGADAQPPELPAADKQNGAPAPATDGSVEPPESEGMTPPELPESEGMMPPGQLESEGEIPPSMPESEGETPPALPESEGENSPAVQPRTYTGYAGGYIYKCTELMDSSVLISFLDINRELQSCLRIALISGVLGIAAWFLVLLMVVFLSKRAIKPIAENIQKQREFITNAGHEIKTPLAVIVSNVDVQELHTGKTKWLDNIRSQALRLSELTKQMLTLSKMDESGGSGFVSVTFDASEEMNNTLRVFEESAALRGMTISRAVDSGVMIHFPKEQFQQLLELLLDNAVKYGREDGTISASLKQERRLVRIRIANDCDELPDAEPKQLFDRFYRADQSRSRSTGGSGIGLAVVRAIAENAGGRAYCTYKEGNVIEFTVELPRKP